MKFQLVIVAIVAGIAMTSALPSDTKKAAKVQTPVLTYRQAMKAKSIGCDICTWIVTEIDKIILDNTTMDEIIVQVEKLCSSLDNYFPGAGQTCNALVEMYLPQIIEQLVENQLSPEKVCGVLTLCPATH